jgi:hypothetical protein
MWRNVRIRHLSHRLRRPDDAMALLLLWNVARSAMFKNIVVTVVVATMAAGCGYVLPSIRLSGRSADLKPLVGEWSGEYESTPPHPRRGTIAFKLAAAEGQAYGDVRMVPEGVLQPYEPSWIAPRSASKSLAIQFVRADQDQVNGELEPYWDSDRDCQAFTSFRGRIKGRTIEGTFVTMYGRPLGETTGVWKVTRR